MRRELVVVALVAALAGACVGGGSIPRVGEPDVARAQARDPEVTRAALERGRSLYLSRCTSCHQAFSPGSRSLGQWRAEVDAMRARAGLEPDEERLILSYLATFSAGAREAGARLDPDAPARP